MENVETDKQSSPVQKAEAQDEMLGVLEIAFNKRGGKVGEGVQVCGITIKKEIFLGCSNLQSK